MLLDKLAKFFLAVDWGRSATEMDDPYRSSIFFYTILFALEFLTVLSLNSQFSCILNTLRLLIFTAPCQKSH